MSLPTWLITYKAKLIEYGVILLAVSIAGIAIYQWGKAEGKSSCLQSQVIEVVAEAKLSTEADKKISDIASKVARLIGTIEGNSAAQTKVIEEYVKNNPRFIDCGIDDDAIRVWNSENKGETTRVPAGAGDKVPKPTTPN